jgi:hypothetical protein
MNTSQRFEHPFHRAAQQRGVMPAHRGDDQQARFQYLLMIVVVLGLARPAVLFRQLAGRTGGGRYPPARAGNLLRLSPGFYEATAPRKSPAG